MRSIDFQNRLFCWTRTFHIRVVCGERGRTAAAPILFHRNSLIGTYDRTMLDVCPFRSNANSVCIQMPEPQIYSHIKSIILIFIYCVSVTDTFFIWPDCEQLFDFIWWKKKNDDDERLYTINDSKTNWVLFILAFSSFYTRDACTWRPPKRVLQRASVLGCQGIERCNAFGIFRFSL